MEQGYVASIGNNHTFSEAVIVHFDPNIISTKDLIEIHLFTHKSTSNHSMRSKYRSAIYVFSKDHMENLQLIIDDFQNIFDHKLITKVYLFKSFKPSQEQFLNYYYKNPAKPFCKTHVNPKLNLLLRKYSTFVNQDKISHLI